MISTTVPIWPYPWTRRDQHRTGEFSALYGGLEQVEIVRSEQRLLPPHMVSQRFERGKLDVQHRAEMVALPLHIGAQGLERVFLNRIADLPEKKTQANGQITEEEDQSRQVADQSAPRLMKVKDMLLKQAIEEARAQDVRAVEAFGGHLENPEEV